MKAVIDYHELSMKQIILGREGDGTVDGVDAYYIIGLSVNGNVYGFDIGRNGWVALSMKEVEGE